MQKVILIVQDGWGIAPKGAGNYIEMAKKPYFDYLIKKYPHVKNKASGNAVGLPKGLQGNSEVGHLHMGAGRIVWQTLEQINNDIKKKNFFKNKALLKAMKTKRLHLLGMCSDEGVHSHLDHLFALMDMAKKAKVPEVYVHFIADGRDVPEKSARKYAQMIKKKQGKIATIVGRYYAMDRDNNWDRTQKAYDLYTKGAGHKAKDVLTAINIAYKRGDKTDYYIEPTLIDEKGLIKKDDSIIFFNFRTDRPRQLTKLFIKNRHKITIMTRYEKDFKCPVAYEEAEIKNNLGEVLAKHKLKQLRLAETEKYGHVTYFFNSQLEKPNKGEDRILIPSPKVPSYDLKPEMSAQGIADEAVKQINKKKYDFILINFANCDLVGHSAVKEAIIKCVSVVDDCTKQVVEAGIKNDYVTIVTADHGSAEEKLYPDGTPKPAHSSNPVNFILVSDKKYKLKPGGQKDVAPTVLKLMGLKQPKEMTGKSLV